jgi:hypothetical protein
LPAVDLAHVADASKAQNSMAAVSAEGSTVCVLIRRLNSSCSRSMALVVRSLAHQLTACGAQPRLPACKRPGRWGYQAAGTWFQRPAGVRCQAQLQEGYSSVTSENGISSQRFASVIQVSRILM